MTTIQNPEQYAVIVTRVVNLYADSDDERWEIAGAVLLAIEHAEVAEGGVPATMASNGYGSSEQRTVVPGLPAVAVKKLVLIFGVPHETAFTKFLDDDKAMKEALEAAKKAAGMAEAAAIVLRDEAVRHRTSSEYQEKRIAELREVEVTGRTRLNQLEGELAKVKRAIGEKAYAEAIK